ncbi:MAG: twin-arginine translocase subunit TatC [Thermoguttaceae bacterium]|jgi:sec-independent protein translocase protein TatC|nr:twin-arginine translocase subunit TatC [Thermoguttaceae bacterium]
MHRSKYEYDEDIFKDSTMTFGEHLEELRRCLFKAVLGLLGGVIIGLFVGGWVVEVINAPLAKSLTSYYQADSEDQVKKALADGAVPGEWDYYRDLIYGREMLVEERYISLPSLVAALRSRYPEVFKDAQPAGEASSGGPASDPAAELTPILLWHPVREDARIQPKGLKPHEGFMIYLQGSLLVGAIIACPWVFYQIWTFVAAGLYPHEKRYVNIYLPFSIGLFLLGVLVAYFFVFGPVLGFLFRFNRWLGITPDLRISEWLGFVLMLPLGFGICFQLPLVMLFLERIGITTVQTYVAYWRVAILVVFVLAAVFTPPDPWSMSLLALPLTFLYFGGILLCKWMPKGRGLLPID